MKFGRHNRICIAASSVALALVQSALGSVTLDRDYKLGEGDNTSGTPTAGALVGSTTSNGQSLDSQGAQGTVTAIPLAPYGGPVYANVAGRPLLVGSGLGVAFDGVDDYLTGFRLGLPATSISSTGSTQQNPNDPSSIVTGTLDYTSISNRGYQFWVRPSSAGSGRDQSVVLDTNQHGVRITNSGVWSLRYGVSANQPVDIDSATSVVFNAWHHVMLVRPYGADGGARLYVDGHAAAFAPGNYDTTDANYLTLGAATGNLADFEGGNEPGGGEFFAGIIDNLEMFVLGLGPSVQYGSFSLQADNQFIASRLSGKPLGDVNLDGVVNQLDINQFVSHWQDTKQVNGRVLGDLETRLNGDLNFDGVVDIQDANALHKGLLAAGSGSGLDFSLLTGTVPEPSSALLLVIAVVCFGARRRA